MTSGNGARSKIKELKKSVSKNKLKQRPRVPEMEHVDTGNSSPTCYQTADNDTSTSDSPKPGSNRNSDTPNTLRTKRLVEIWNKRSKGEPVARVVSGWSFLFKLLNV